MMRHVWILFLAAMMLVGCGSRQVVVTEVVTRYVVLDDSFIPDCPTVKPPDKLVYKAATLQQRVDMWSATYLAQSKQNAQCRVISRSAREYNARKREEVSKMTCVEGKCK